MTLKPAAIWVIVLIFGFLASSSVYYYSKDRSERDKKNNDSATFSADLTILTASESSKKIDELTKPAEPKGRLSYPKNVYTVGASETLFGLGSKFGIDWKIIKLANGITNENLIQSGTVVVVPKMDPTTDRFRVSFVLNEDKATQLNRDLSELKSDPSFTPIAVAKNNAAG